MFYNFAVAFCVGAVAEIISYLATSRTIHPNDRSQKPWFSFIGYVFFLFESMYLYRSNIPSSPLFYAILAILAFFVFGALVARAILPLEPDFVPYVPPHD